MQKREKEGKKKLKYDHSDGLLPEIRRICGYPEHIVEEQSPRVPGKRKKQVEEEWKWVEAQICGLCSIGGDILCCEDCPASFHLACIGFEASDIPDGPFYCNRCQSLPKNVQLFPPEKCSTSVSPQNRIENENERNWEAVDYHHKRLRREAEELSSDDKFIGPQTEIDAMKSSFPDRFLLKALEMANPMDFTLPPQFLLERDFFPNDSMEEKRPKLKGEMCVECEMQDDWSPMINCDFCELVWHQKCVYPPLINIPRVSYWMCPRHTETVIDSVLMGEELTRDEREVLYREYDSTEVSFKTFEKFCSTTEHLRLEAEINDTNKTIVTYYAPEDDTNACSVSTVQIQRKNNLRKGGRGKKKNETRFFINSFGLEGISDSSKVIRKSSDPARAERKDRVLERLDQKRSQKFSEEDLIRSIMPYNENARAEYLTQKLLGTDIEASASFLNRHVSMTARSHIFYRNFSEKELIKLMRHDLDPVETVRGSGAQSICAVQEKTYRKKLKVDVELLVQLIGFGNEQSERTFSSFKTEAYFRRCMPPPSAQNILSQKTLREVALNSQQEAQDISQAFKYHPNTENLENFILLGYETSFKNAQERDSYFPSSMTIWSKEPISALTAKWVEESGFMRPKSETPIESDVSSSVIERGASEEPFTSEKVPTEADFVFAVPDCNTKLVIVEPEVTMSTSEELPNSPKSSALENEAKVEEAIEKKEETATNENIDPAVQYRNDTGPLEPAMDVTIDMIEKLALANFKEVKMQDHYEKAESVHEAEGYLGEGDYIRWDKRTTKSLSNLVERPFWQFIHQNLQTVIRRAIQHQSTTEHNYALFDEVQRSNDQQHGLRKSSSMEVLKEKYEDYDDRDSHSPVDFASPYQPSRYYSNYANPSLRKRGRPKGSKNRKDGETAPPRRKNSGISKPVRGRGRGGRPRGSRAARIIRSSTSSTDGAGPSRRQSVTFSFEEPESPETSTASVSKRLQDEVEEARQKYANLFIMKSLEDTKDEYYRARDEALESWTDEDRKSLNERVWMGRLESLIPFEPRYFLPTQRVLARLEIPGHPLPIAIQRCLTKFGTAHDCHVRIDKYISTFCNVFAEYHCDIVREYHSDTFYLSTLATETVIVDDVVVRRPRLVPLEAAEKTRTGATTPSVQSRIKCRCQKYSDQLISYQDSCGESIASGIIKLENGARIQIGCATFTFFKT